MNSAMNLETPFWKSRATFWAASVVLALSIFFSVYDFGWRPHQSLQSTLFFAALAPLILLAGTATCWLVGRLFRVPVEWGFLLRIEVWLALIATPFYLLSVICERVFAWQQNGRSFAIWMGGIWIALWCIQIVRRYGERANRVSIAMFCAVIALLSASSTIGAQRGPSLQVAGAQPWRWQSSGRVRLAYTDEYNSPPFARRDARNADEMLRRIEKELGVARSQTPVNVYLFPSLESLREFAEDDSLDGVAGLSGVLVADDEWEWMRGPLTHELCHFVIAREFGPDVRALADEGTAVWIEEKLAPVEEALKPQRQKNFRSSEVARNEDFYDYDGEQISANYQQAGWLAQATIKKHGLAKWREFLGACQSGLLTNLSESSEDASEQVTAQYRQIFGEPMP